MASIILIKDQLDEEHKHNLSALLKSVGIEHVIPCSHNAIVINGSNDALRAAKSLISEQGIEIL